jgi:hypothetical protein
VLWNQGINTDGEVTANRPHIIIKKKKEKTCILIDMAIPADRNVTKKEAEEKLKYNSLCIEIQRMWNKKCMIIPVIIGATETVTKVLKFLTINCQWLTKMLQFNFTFVSVQAEGDMEKKNAKRRQGERENCVRNGWKLTNSPPDEIKCITVFNKLTNKHWQCYKHRFTHSFNSMPSSINIK